MSFKYYKKGITIWAWNGLVIGFLRLLIFADLKFSINQTIIESNQTVIERTILHLTFFILNLSFFVLDLKVHYSNSMRLTFGHGLPTLQTQWDLHFSSLCSLHIGGKYFVGSKDKILPSPLSFYWVSLSTKQRENGNHYIISLLCFQHLSFSPKANRPIVI